MRVFPHDIVAGKAYIRDVERNMAKLTDKPALILWPDSDPGFSDADLGRWQGLFPEAQTVHLERTGQFIDEDAPDDVASAIETWWAATGESGSEPGNPKVSAGKAGGGPGAGRRRSSAPS